jgi:hypothetical protein
MTLPGETPGSSRLVEAVPSAAAEDPTWNRLEDQISWYDRRSGDNHRRYKWLKLPKIAVAASLPVVAAMHSPVSDGRETVSRSTKPQVRLPKRGAR